MTPAKRAEKIVKSGFQNLASYIAAQIEEAISDEWKENMKHCEACGKQQYQNGFSAAKEQAADEVRSYLFAHGLSTELLDLANEIEKMEPDK